VRREQKSVAAPRRDIDELLGLVPLDTKKPYDVREVIARIVDGSDFLDFKPGYGVSTVCGHAALDGHAVGLIGNNGPIDPAGATKASHFIQACCQSGTPIIYLQNTTGYIVGKASEQAGMIKHGAKMIQAVANATCRRSPCTSAPASAPATTACAAAPTARASPSPGPTRRRR
jgi:geranyl-CoA carboxylase beta subunit